MTKSKGGVEDTWLEAKAKDTQKNPRPRTAFPRTDPLEAKDRNARGQGQRPRAQAQVFFKKKKVFKNFFQAISKIKGLLKFFQAFSSKKRRLKFFFQASSSFFIARFSVRVAGAVAQDLAATPHGLPSFHLGEVPSDSILDPQRNWSI